MISVHAINVRNPIQKDSEIRLRLERSTTSMGLANSLEL